MKMTGWRCGGSSRQRVKQSDDHSVVWCVVWCGVARVGGGVASPGAGEATYLLGRLHINLGGMVMLRQWAAHCTDYLHGPSCRGASSAGVAASRRWDSCASTPGWLYPSTGIHHHFRLYLLLLLLLSADQSLRFFSFLTLVKEPFSHHTD